MIQTTTSNTIKPITETVETSVTVAVENLRDTLTSKQAEGVMPVPPAGYDDQKQVSAADRVIARLKKAGVEDKELASRFDTFKGADQLVKDVRSIGDTENMVFYGPSGRGKTHLAIAVMADYAERHPDADMLFIGLPILLPRIKETFRDDSPMSERALIDYFCSMPLLVLDDLGTEHATDYSTATLFAIIYQRNRKNCKTIITTNLTPTALAKHLRLMGAESRLAAWEGITISSMPDYRQKVVKFKQKGAL